MSYRCIHRNDPVRAALSALQRSVYDELILNSEWEPMAYQLGNRRVVVPRGCTLFSLAGLAAAARVELTLARKTVDRLEELGVFDKITAYTDLQLPEVELTLIAVGIPVLIGVEGIVKGKVPTIARFRNPDALFGKSAEEGKVKGKVAIPVKGKVAIGVTIGVDPKTAKHSGAIETPKPVASSLVASSLEGGGAPPPPDQGVHELWGQLQRLRAEVAPEASPDPGVGRGARTARLAATLEAIAELLDAGHFGGRDELLEGYRRFLADPWGATRAPPWPLPAFVSLWARYAGSPRPRAELERTPAPEITCLQHPDRRALDPLNRQCGDCALESVRARARGARV